jgi:hypothetical protein
MNKFKLYLKKLFARRILITKETNTPILFDDYNTNEYYYILNNNINMIYSLCELYQLLEKKKMIDPFTQLPILSYELVRVSISK